MLRSVNDLLVGKEGVHFVDKNSDKLATKRFGLLMGKFPFIWCLINKYANIETVEQSVHAQIKAVFF